MGTVTVTTFSTDTETVTRAKLNGLAANLVTEFNGNIDNDNIASDAAIANSKLNLTTITQAVTVTGGLASSRTTTGTVLMLTNSGNGPHLNFAGDPTVASPSDGDVWFDGTNLKIRIGATTYNFDRTAE